MKRLFYILFAVLLPVSLIFAQGGGSSGSADVRSIAMGKTYTATSRGVYAIGKNPANLAMPSEGRWELATVLPLPNLDFSIGNDFLTFDEYNYYFGGVPGPDGKKVGRELTGADIDRFIALMEDGTGVYSDFSNILFSISFNHSQKIGSFGFTIADRMAVKGAFPSQFLEILLKGNETGRVYNFVDTELESWYLREYAFSYAREISGFEDWFDKLAVGATVKMINGFWYAGFEAIRSELTTSELDYGIGIQSDLAFNIAVSPNFGVVYDFEAGDTVKHTNINPFPSPAGKGYGFDFGVSGQINEAWSFGLAFTDLGSVNWDNDAVEYRSKTDFLLYNITEKEHTDSLVNSLKGKGRYIPDFNTSLAAALRVGVSLQLDKYYGFNTPVLIALDYNQGLNELPSNSLTPRFSIGAEVIPVSWLPVRSGFSFGGRDGFNWGLGFGLRAGLLEFDIATSDFHSLLAGNSAERVGVAVGSRWRF